MICFHIIVINALSLCVTFFVSFSTCRCQYLMIIIIAKRTCCIDGTSTGNGGLLEEIQRTSKTQSKSFLITIFFFIHSLPLSLSLPCHYVCSACAYIFGLARAQQPSKCNMEFDMINDY